MNYTPSNDFIERTMERVRTAEPLPSRTPAPEPGERAARAAALAFSASGAFLGLAGFGRLCLHFLFPASCV